MAGDPTKPPETPPSGEEGATVQSGVAKMPNAVFAGRGSWVGKQKWHPRETSPEQPKGQRFSCRSFGDMALGVEPFQPLLQKMSHDGPPAPQGTLHKRAFHDQIHLGNATSSLPLPGILIVHYVKGSKKSCREEP